MKRIFNICLIIFVFVFHKNTHAQTILNGSFEETLAGMVCTYNLSNPVFNSQMSDVYAYGAANETDILINDCYVRDIPDGFRAVGIAGSRDEIALAVDAPLTAGSTYTLSFWVFSADYRPRGDLEIGCSTISTDFGTLIYTAATVSETWVNYEVTFVAPVAAEFITVRNVTGGIFWNHVDHFALLDVLPEVTMTPVSCNGLCDGTATVESLGDIEPYSFLWDDEAGSQTTITAEDLCAGTYTVEVTDGDGDVEILEVTVTEPDLIEIDEMVLTPINCFGDGDGSLMISATGGTGVLTYVMDDIEYPEGALTGLDAGEYVLQILDENDCYQDVAFEIIEPARLELSLVSTVDVLCFGESTGEILLSSTGGTGAVEFSIDGVVFLPSSSFTDLSAGDYTIIARDFNSCEASLEITLVENPELSVTIDIVDEICFGDCLGTINLVASGGVPDYSYSIDDCVTPALIGAYSDLCAGDYSICITDAVGCTFTASGIVEEGSITEVDATIRPIGPFCLDDGPTSFDVGTAGGVFSGRGVEGINFNPILAGAGDHEINYIVTEGCGDEDSRIVTVYPLPAVDFDVDKIDGCMPQKIEFTGASDAAVTCEWNFGDGATSNVCDAVVHVYELPGLYSVKYIVTDVNGCSNSRTKSDLIRIYDLPNANFDYSPNTIYTLDPYVKFKNLSDGEIAWEWIFGDLGNSTTENPEYNFPEIQNDYPVTLIVEDTHGCKDSITKTVKIVEDVIIYVPNAFTPDGDDFNAVVKPYMNGVDVYDYTFLIFNRWGELLFESHNLNVGWNGNYNGKVAEAGVYVWQIVAKEIVSDKKLSYQGQITLLK